MRIISRISASAKKQPWNEPELLLMTTLTSARLAPLLDRLFEEAEASETEVDTAVAALPTEERARLMRSKTEYRDLYGRLKNEPLAVSRQTGALL
jgi:hypothetical protein